MLRAVLLGLLVVSSACSKSSTESAAKVQPGVAAGKVLEAKGSVQVKRADATKPLAVGDTVEGADIVITGADGSVVIELAHNSARWELGANKQQKVSESIAWKATKATAEEVEHATAAAGRPAERSAAGTVAMAADEGAAAPAPEAAPAPAAEPEPDLTPKGGSAPPVERKRVRRAPAKAAAAAPVEEEANEADDDEAPAPRTTRGATMKKSADAPVAAAAPAAPQAETASAPVAEKPRVIARSIDPVSGLLAQKGDALHKCVATHGAKAAVSLTVEVTDGKATVKLASKEAVSAALDKCIKGVVGGINFSGSGKTTRVITP